MATRKHKDVYKGDFINAWEDKDGWLYLDFLSNMTTLAIPDVFKNEVFSDLKKLVKSVSK